MTAAGACEALSSAPGVLTPPLPPSPLLCVLLLWRSLLEAETVYEPCLLGRSLTQCLLLGSRVFSVSKAMSLCQGLPKSSSPRLSPPYLLLFSFSCQCFQLLL